PVDFDIAPIPAVLHIACLRQMLQPPSDTAEIGEKYPARS
ncbi:hypothetical protein ACQR75_13230, partial [Klebsiella pneumoniae]